MITSQYGVKILESGDKGDVVFDSINDNFILQRDHSHNGVNSVKVNSSELQKESVVIPEADWILRGDGLGYEKTINLPGGYTLENCVFRCRVTSGTYWNMIIHPSIEPASLTTVTLIVGQRVPLQVLFV